MPGEGNIGREKEGLVKVGLKGSASLFKEIQVLA
jgi:hypothetical protein